MLYSEKIKRILENSGVDTSTLPDNLYSTLLTAFLNAEMSGGLTQEEVEKIVTDEVAKIIADAPEDFDTLKEMSDWISKHEDSAAAMNSAIQENTKDVSTLKSQVSENIDTLGYSISEEPSKGSVDKRLNNVNSNVDLLNKMISMSSAIESKANTWFRLFEYNSSNSSQQNFSNPTLATFTILRAYSNSDNELHQITLKCIYRKLAFVDENSYSNQHAIEKIRLVQGGDNKCYIDIYYGGSSFVNRFSGYVTNGVSASSTIYWKGIEKPYIVDETVEGETVKTVYEFSANKSIESRIAALEAAILNS